MTYRNLRENYTPPVEMKIVLLSPEPFKTCATCALSSKDALTGMAHCGRGPDPVSGKPIRLCHTERLVGMPERTVALKATEQLHVCGPDGNYWVPYTPTPRVSPLRRWIKFWSFWK